MFAPTIEVTAHCDLPCGVYDPAQARIEAQSIKGILEKYHNSDDTVFRTRALIIKEERSELVKHHLWVLWTDYFKPPHFEKYPQLHELFNQATKLAGGSGGTKDSTDVEVADRLLGKIDEIAEIFWEPSRADSEHGHSEPLREPLRHVPVVTGSAVAARQAHAVAPVFAALLLVALLHRPADLRHRHPKAGRTTIDRRVSGKLPKERRGDVIVDASRHLRCRGRGRRPTR